MNDGLKDSYRKAIIGVLAANPRVERVVLFGSRAMGTFSSTSDIDLALFGDDLTLDDQSDLYAKIEELSIPQQVDLVLHNRIRNKKLIGHIQRYGVEWFRWIDNKEKTSAMGGEWKEASLGQLSEILTGKLDSNQANNKGTYPFFTCAPTPLLINDYAFDCEAILLAGNNANGVFHLNLYKGKFNAYQRTYVITITDTSIINYQYLKHIMESNLMLLKQNSVGSQTKYLTLGVIQSLIIPIPTMDEQQVIVSEIDEEMSIIEQNKRLIEIFEQKIKDKISEVWGE